MLTCLKNRFSWQQGRQGTGYKKFKIFESKLFHADCWLLRYDVGDYIPWHKDPIEGYEHHRLNILLWDAKEGGKLIRLCPSPIANVGAWIMPGRISLFRSDLIKHMVTEVRAGKRIVLTFGLAIKE